MSDHAAISAVVFDVGNVLIEWDPQHLYRKLLPDEAAVEHAASALRKAIQLSPDAPSPPDPVLGRIDP